MEREAVRITDEVGAMQEPQTAGGDERPTENSRATVITVLYNSESTLQRFFAGLEQQPERIAQVVLVDNDSTDGTVSTAERLATEASFPVRIVQGANVGFAAGYRVGEAAVDDARLPVLCLNPDVELGPGIVAAMLAALANDPKVGVVTAPLTLENGEPDPASERTHPSLIGASVYALFGKLTPKRFRYNAIESRTDDVSHRPREIDATTGALMLIRTEFRAAGQGIFDTDYWMYGEDLQLCLDAKHEGYTVVMIQEVPASVHVKGVSSGLPRRLKSNIAFHRAMYIYFGKNHASSPFTRAIVRAAIAVRLVLSVCSSGTVRLTRRLRGVSAHG